ncbi:MAG: beta-ketoacyl-ACP synthase II [Thermoleophilia bacterium]
MRRVVVTGVGAVTPVAPTMAGTWEGLVAGRSGIDWIRTFDPTGFPVRVAGEVDGFDPEGLLPPRELKRVDLFIQYALASAREAIGELGFEGYDRSRCGVVLGSCIGGFHELMRQHEILMERGHERVSPFFLPNVLVDSASGQVAIQLGITGPNFAVVSACATGSHAIADAAEFIRRGEADAMLAGGTEACIHPLILAGFCAMRGLAEEEEDPPHASRPFDATRAGFVMAEGAGMVLLEELEAARARGATIYAELLGSGNSNDAHHMAQPEPEAAGVVAMMRQALERAGVAPERVGYINAHGTSTPLGDAAETKAIRDVFGSHAYELAVSSTKSMTGHMFGGAAAVEAIVCCLAIHHGVVPPTINYRNPDPDCDLDYVPNEARRVELDVALSNSMGLGGHNGCVLFGRVG